MAQAPGILKSMIDSIDGDVKGLSVVRAQVVELAGKIGYGHNSEGSSNNVFEGSACGDG
jgi:hypothetical protein